ncbi:MAG: hypothetical protein AAF483_19690 [Planctomycetota bacterium]
MKFPFIRLIVLFFFGLTLGCGGDGVREPAEINVDEVQADYNDWVAKRTQQIQDNPNLSDADKEQMIKEVQESAVGQMNEVKNLADGQSDERSQGDR